MAESLDDGEFWLPAQFLDDDVFVEEDELKKNDKKMSSLNMKDEPDCFKNFFPFDLGSGFSSSSSSDLSSPNESVIGSTEESDEEDFLAGLSCKLARSVESTEPTKDVVLSGSPQSTLCGISNGCRCSQGSSRGSPNGLSKSPPSPPATWDLLHAAAGEVAKIRMNQQQEENNFYHNYNNYGFNKGILGPPRKPSPDFGLYSTNPQHHSLAYQKTQAAQFQLLRRQQMMKQQQQRSSTVWGRQETPPVVQRGRNNGRTLGLSASAWPTLQQVHQQQQQNPQGMRALFLGNPGGAKRECAGTGVFLPRPVGAAPTTESRKKPGCSTVLLPARVVQALNLNLDEIGGLQTQAQPRYRSNFNPDSDKLLRFPNNGLNQRRNQRPQIHVETNSSELRLPQEWTY